jgi:hypothetical protein
MRRHARRANTRRAYLVLRRGAFPWRRFHAVHAPRQHVSITHSSASTPYAPLRAHRAIPASPRAPRRPMRTDSTRRAPRAASGCRGCLACAVACVRARPRRCTGRHCPDAATARGSREPHARDGAREHAQRMAVAVAGRVGCGCPGVRGQGARGARILAAARACLERGGVRGGAGAASQTAGFGGHWR